MEKFYLLILKIIQLSKYFLIQIFKKIIDELM